MSDEEYSRFQFELLANPYRGDIIQGTGGLIKIRVDIKGKGKPAVLWKTGSKAIRVKGEFSKLLSVLESLKKQKAGRDKPIVRVNVGAILYGCPSCFMHVPKIKVET
ncbi:hypothetical protein THIOM_002263, partial [Candidatus Thiomargarita nelsonii]